ncbi:hypothetical protein CRUP_032904 [Coryphaenoides rupestris]|nr:hypothetical protein CRUP_032904 [Coryphaenoides rupestris]
MKFAGKTSFGMSIFNLSNAIMGLGILGLAFAMSNTGIVLFIILLVAIAILSAYSIHLLLKSADVVGYLGYTSGLSLSCMVFFLISVIYKKFNIPCPLTEYNSSMTDNTPINATLKVDKGTCEAKYFTVNSQTAYTIPILAFAFVCHPEVLPIYTELRDATKKRMQKVANISILTMFPELLHTYSRVNPLDVHILCVRLAVLLAVTLTVPVVLFPLSLC